MSTGPFSTYQVHEWLGDIATGWAALHFDNPETAGAYASEFFGGSYTRIAYTMTQPTNRGMFTLTDLVFTGLPAGKILYIAGWDAQYNGNYLWSAPLPSPVTVLAGKSKSFPAGTIGLSMS